MTSGKRITPAMEEYIRKHQDRLFPAEIAYNLGVLYGCSLTRVGVRQHIQRMRRAESCK